MSLQPPSDAAESLAGVNVSELHAAPVPPGGVNFPVVFPLKKFKKEIFTARKYQRCPS